MISKLTLQKLILQKIAELGEVMLDGFFPAKYPQARIWRELLGTKSSYKFSKATFSSTLYRLRDEGLVEKRAGVRRKTKWGITDKGRDLLAPVSYDGITRVVAFDIPEKQRKKRRWIREELLGLGYEPLQKSVWVGFAPLPDDFFEDLDLLSLREHIHIFSVYKEGTITKS